MEPTDWRRKPASDNQGRGAGAGGGPHLVHVDVVEVVFVVNGLEHALQLPRGAAVDHQHEGDSDGVGEHIFHRVLVPLHVLVGFAWGKTRETTGRGEHPRFFAGGGRMGSFSDASSWGLSEGHGHGHMGPRNLRQPASLSWTLTLSWCTHGGSEVL